MGKKPKAAGHHCLGFLDEPSPFIQPAVDDAEAHMSTKSRSMDLQPTPRSVSSESASDRLGRTRIWRRDSDQLESGHVGDVDETDDGTEDPFLQYQLDLRESPFSRTHSITSSFPSPTVVSISRPGSLESTHRHQPLHPSKQHRRNPHSFHGQDRSRWPSPSGRPRRGQLRSPDRITTKAHCTTVSAGSWHRPSTVGSESDAVVGGEVDTEAGGEADGEAEESTGSSSTHTDGPASPDFFAISATEDTGASSGKAMQPAQRIVRSPPLLLRRPIRSSTPATISRQVNHRSRGSRNANDPSGDAAPDTAVTPNKKWRRPSAHSRKVLSLPVAAVSTQRRSLSQLQPSPSSPGTQRRLEVLSLHTR